MQVLIAGAGPVGLTMAIELARYGVAVRIVDKSPQRTDKSKALVLWSRTLELLDRSDCSGALVAAGHKVDAANIISESRLIGRLNFDGVDSSYPYALMLPQSDTERLLEAHLATLGVNVERESELLAFTDHGDGVTATLRRADGSEQALKSGWLIGCDGAHSTVRHTLGLVFEGETLQSDWVLADIHLTGMSLPASELGLYWHAAGVLAIFPISPGRYRIIADIGRSDGSRPADPTIEQIQAIVDQRGPGGLVVSAPLWLSAFRINERKVANYRLGRVFVAGDAAHVHSPAGGQGMNTGMQDACNLAWKLALICHGTCNGETLLDSYSIERSAVGAQVLAAAGRLTALAVIRNHAVQTIRNLIGGFLLGLAPVRHAIRDSMAEVSIGYRNSPLNGKAAHEVNGPAPGERVPPVNGQLAVGSGNAPRFALFAAPGDAVSRLLHEYRDMLEAAVRPPCAPGGMWLVRPDGYVGCAVREGDFQAIADYFDALGRAAVSG